MAVRNTSFTAQGRRDKQRPWHKKCLTEEKSALDDVAKPLAFPPPKVIWPPWTEISDLYATPYPIRSKEPKDSTVYKRDGR